MNCAHQYLQCDLSSVIRVYLAVPILLKYFTLLNLRGTILKQQLGRLFRYTCVRRLREIYSSSLLDKRYMEGRRERER